MWRGWLKPRPGRFTPGKDPVPLLKYYYYYYYYYCYYYYYYYY
jgi:hypothetical protein